MARANARLSACASIDRRGPRGADRGTNQSGITPGEQAERRSRPVRQAWDDGVNGSGRSFKAVARVRIPLGAPRLTCAFLRRDRTDLPAPTPPRDPRPPHPDRIRDTPPDPSRGLTAPTRRSQPGAVPRRPAAEACVQVDQLPVLVRRPVLQPHGGLIKIHRAWSTPVSDARGSARHQRPAPA